MEQNAEFREALQESRDKVIVGAAPGDFFWGSGLSADHTKQTKKGARVKARPTPARSHDQDSGNNWQ